MAIRSKKPRRKNIRPQAIAPFHRYDIETVLGLENYVETELLQLSGTRRALHKRTKPGRIRIDYAGDPNGLINLRSAVAVYGTLSVPTKRPTGLLGHSNFTTLVSKARDVMKRYPAGTFTTLSMSASGKETKVIRRIIDSLCDELGLAYEEGQGDLAIALTRSSQDEPGWDVSIRLTPRPLSTRSWRVCNMPGAINATVAHVVAQLTDPAPHQHFLNLACGSSTIMIERLGIGPVRSAVGVDIDSDALECSAQNLAAGDFTDDARLVCADAVDLPFPDASFDAIVADLPFGMLVARNGDNAVFYPKLLTEAARVAKSGAIFSLIAVDHRSIQQATASLGNYWRIKQTVPFKLSFKRGYISPSIFALERSGVEVTGD